MRHRFIALLVLFTIVFFSSAEAQTTARKFEAGKNTFLLDGKPFVVKAAELHYTRIPQAYWDHRIEMCKALGMNTICHRPPRSVCVCGMGNGRIALVVAEKERRGTPHARSLLYGTGRRLHERSRQATGTATGQ